MQYKYQDALFGQEIEFYFKAGSNYIEMKFDAPQKNLFTGWEILPHKNPCKVCTTIVLIINHIALLTKAISSRHRSFWFRDTYASYVFGISISSKCS